MKMKTIRKDERNIGQGRQRNEGHGIEDIITLYSMKTKNITMELIVLCNYNILIKL